ncbi:MULTISPECIES: efflux RND transporter permease subunit [unclassified Wenzhouxiangella]|uniref:efflux RND transporter permease subunit n=1 Tax=unclassified Wenzhouxiangella TaxID=2613841 RepID=UPI000E325B81|nr:MULTISPECIES: efflux RND transporter permease subunit [unclassified Wenzhouxiangella]RFF28099.1 efflux RND transporter permease subunit [Wenzhouxiangella sp. 15181]RFP68104.1 efflux RND transporter permease subunit [Wenzhouxiangella sp. 15190]
MSQDQPSMGPSGHIARAFQDSRLTPLLAAVGIIAGLLAVVITPKEEEPQIDVTMADVFVPFPGASAEEVEFLITNPGEQIFDEISDVKHVYSTSRQGQAVITVEFEVGIPRQDALIRLYNKVYSNTDWFPADLGAGQPVVKPKGIDDVPIVTLTLYDPDRRQTGEELTRLAHTLEVALKRVSGTRDVYTVGGVPDRVDVVFDPASLAGYGMTLADVRDAIRAANSAAGETRIMRDGVSIPLQPGSLLETAEQVRRLVVGLHGDTAVRLGDIAEVRRGETVPDQSVMLGLGPGSEDGQGQVYPAVTLAVAKKPGENAIDIADAVKERLDILKGRVIPDNTEVLVTRNYGETASDKARSLIRDLISATVAVILLVLATMGWRQAMIVGTSVLVTLLLTLVFSWAWGFTLNRVSLFALIFSIGILVDDAIVIVENVHRRISISKRPIRDIVPAAVDEVGTPTIMATLTVMAALIPMAFVTGLMGPYMGPIPINASAGMVLSQVVAFVLAPWLAVRLLRRERGSDEADSQQSESSIEGISPRLRGIFSSIFTPFLGDNHRNRWLLTGAVVGLTLLVALLPVFQAVVLKMLPFDDKSELQVVVDMPENTPMEETMRVLMEMGDHVSGIDSVTDWQAYAGTASPINFNGLVRQYYLRGEPYHGDLQINLIDEGRDRQSHEIALDLRGPMTEIGERYGAAVKIVEVPPGPPVLSPVVAEVYGPTPEARAEQAKSLARHMERIDGLVDIDTTVTAPTERWQVVIDRHRAATLGISQAQVVDALAVSLGERNVGYLRDPGAKHAVPIRVILSEGDKAQPSALMSLPVMSRDGEMIRLADVARIEQSQWPGIIYHKDLLPVTYVTADMAGDIDSPLYGMFALASELYDQANAPTQYWINQPEWPGTPALKWDGEWQITYETFRDMGLAYAVGVFVIFLLLVAQFRAYLIPLIVMAPIPLTLIGILPGHALLGREFTATSMIGMIALAGIIVRNSILLVVFIRQLLDEGESLEDAVVLAGVVRLKPIALTAISAMLGAAFILPDPIFNGLSISLIFGLAVSTLLTVLLVPLLYYVFIGKSEVQAG